MKLHKVESFNLEQTLVRKVSCDREESIDIRYQSSRQELTKSFVQSVQELCPMKYFRELYLPANDALNRFHNCWNAFILTGSCEFQMPDWNDRASMPVVMPKFSLPCWFPLNQSAKEFFGYQNLCEITSQLTQIFPMRQLWCTNFTPNGLRLGATKSNVVGTWSHRHGQGRDYLNKGTGNGQIMIWRPASDDVI